MWCIIVRHRCCSLATRHKHRLAPCCLPLEVNEPNWTKLPSIQPRTIGCNLFPSWMALLYIWVKFYNSCMDRPLQPNLFHTPTKAYKTTSMMDHRTYGLWGKATTQERKQDDCCWCFELTSRLAERNRTWQWTGCCSPRDCLDLTIGHRTTGHCSFEPENGSYCPGGNEMSFRSSSILN